MNFKTVPDINIKKSNVCAFEPIVGQFDCHTEIHTVIFEVLRLLGWVQVQFRMADESGTLFIIIGTNKGYSLTVVVLVFKLI